MSKDEILKSIEEKYEKLAPPAVGTHNITSMFPALGGSRIWPRNSAPDDHANNGSNGLSETTSG